MKTTIVKDAILSHESFMIDAKPHCKNMGYTRVCYSFYVNVGEKKPGSVCKISPIDRVNDLLDIYFKSSMSHFHFSCFEPTYWDTFRNLGILLKTTL